METKTKLIENKIKKKIIKALDFIVRQGEN